MTCPLSFLLRPDPDLVLVIYIAAFSDFKTISCQSVLCFLFILRVAKSYTVRKEDRGFDDENKLYEAADRIEREQGKIAMGGLTTTQHSKRKRKTLMTMRSPHFLHCSLHCIRS